MKIFITSLFLFFAVSLFAQPQKGDLYFGFSNFGLRNTHRSDAFFVGLNQTNLSMLSTFGKFVTDNTLIGGGISFFTSISAFSEPSNFFGINLLGAQYFGKGKLKGLSQITLNSNLTRNDFQNIRRSLTGELGLGGAYFVNEFTSVQLLYKINLFNAVEQFDTEYFANNLEPNIGLSIRTLLLQNREGVENLSALNTIKKGTKVISLSARLQDNSTGYSHSYNSELDYFFINNAYGNVALSSSLSKGEQFNSRFTGFIFSINTGYYVRVTDKFYGKFSTGFNHEKVFSKFTLDSIERSNGKMNINRWNTEIGLAFFLGRHKLEPGLELYLSSTNFENFDFERMQDFSTNMFINYEWLLAENFAFAASSNFQANEVFYSVFFDSFSSFEPTSIRFTNNSANLLVGFKWYLSTPKK